MRFAIPWLGIGLVMLVAASALGAVDGGSAERWSSWPASERAGSTSSWQRSIPSRPSTSWSTSGLAALCQEFSGKEPYN